MPTKSKAIWEWKIVRRVLTFTRPTKVLIYDTEVVESEGLRLYKPIERYRDVTCDDRVAFTAGQDRAFLLDPKPLPAGTAQQWGVVAEVVPNGQSLSRARELAELYLKAPEVTRRNTRVHFIQPLKERVVREVGYGLALEGLSSADLVKSKQVKSEPVARMKKTG